MYRLAIGIENVSLSVAHKNRDIEAIGETVNGFTLMLQFIAYQRFIFALKAIYRDRWPAISAILSESDPRSAHRELIALEQEGRLSAADVKILRSAEGALFDSLLPGDSSAPQALAKLVALLVRHKIAAAAGR